MKVSELRSIIREMVVETAYEKDMDESGPVIASGVMGVKSKPFRKKFKNYRAFEKWIDSNDGEYEIHHVHNE